MIEIDKGIVLFFLSIVLLIVYAFLVDPKAQEHENQSVFKEECSALGGKTVWNGRHWVCLK